MRRRSRRVPRRQRHLHARTRATCRHLLERTLELGPVLSILTEDQKNLLICRAIQKDPELAQHLLDMAAEPITPEEAASRVKSAIQIQRTYRGSATAHSATLHGASARSFSRL